MEKLIKELKYSKIDSIGVVGDSILDEYVYGDSDYIEMPIFIPDKRYMFPGGAANVANNVKRMSGNVRFFTVLGSGDRTKKFINLLEGKKIGRSALVFDNKREICHKKRLVSNNEIIVRIDEDYINDLNENTEERFINTIRNNCEGITVCCLSNYYKGCISNNVFNKIKKICLENDIKIIADCSRMHDFSGIYLLKPNLDEFKILSGESLENIDDVIKAGIKFKEENKIINLLVTASEKGAVLIDSKDECHVFSSVCDNVVDPCGAGDTMMAAIAVCAANNIDIKEAVQLSLYAASVCCQNKGTYAVSMADIEKLYSSIIKGIESYE